MSHPNDPRHTHRGTTHAGDPRSDPQKVEGTAVSTLRRTTDHLETLARSRRQASHDRAVARALSTPMRADRTYDYLSASHR